MVTTDYHVRTVLRTYGRQLLQARLLTRSDRETSVIPDVKVTISEEAKQRLLMDRIKSQGVEEVQPQQGESTK
jgi:hypothetical protein